MNHGDMRRDALRRAGQAGYQVPTENPIAPGKRTLTMGLAARAACEPAPIQRRESSEPSATGPRASERATLDAWMDVAMRPDLHGEAVQCKRMDMDHDPAAPANAGGSGRPLPDQVGTKMERAFSSDFSNVRIHEGQEATRLGALAYTQGTDIHFAPGHYDPSSQRGQELLGHELTHVVQQSQGRVQATTQSKGVGINDESALEREADEFGARAARGESVAAGPETLATNPGAVVQRYVDQTLAGQPWRVADDLTIAIRQDSPIYGSHHFYAEGALIGTANAQLDASGSHLALKSGAGTMAVTDGKDTKNLARVEPENKKDKSQGNNKPGMNWPDDCGLAANAVMQGDDRETRAVYHSPPDGWFERLCAWVTNESTLERETDAFEYGTDTESHRGETLHTPHIMVDEIMKATLDKDPTKAWAKYQALSPGDREAFDKQVGINKYAAPEVGEAFSIVSNKDELVDGKAAWNFHWGGVVMKSGGDFVTMENFAGSGQDAWDFQMYGSANKAGQTFHEQQEARTHGTQDEYGPNPTTIRVRPK